MDKITAGNASTDEECTVENTEPRNKAPCILNCQNAKNIAPFDSDMLQIATSTITWR